MNDILEIAGAFACAVGMGGLFFGGLHWATHKGLQAKNPVFWFMASAALRMGLLCVGVYLVVGSDWLLMLVCLAGLVTSRLLVLGLVAPHAMPTSVKALKRHES